MGTKYKMAVVNLVNFTCNPDMRFALITTSSGGSHSSSTCYLSNDEAYQAMYYIKFDKQSIHEVFIGHSHIWCQ